AWTAGWHALVQPLLGIGTVLILIRLVAGDSPVAPVQWVRQRSARLLGLAYGAPGQSRPVRAGARLLGTLVGAAVGVTPVLLPLPDKEGDNAPAALPFLGVATPEFGKLLFLPVLAVVVARDSHRFDGGQSLRLLSGLTRSQHPANRLGRARAVFL